MKFPRVSIFGLGYVGSVTAACLAERGCSVVGCDVAEAKVKQINAGEAPIREPGLDALLKEQQKAGEIRATVSAAEAVLDSDVSIICVGTPSLPSGALDLQYVEAVASEISSALESKTSDHAVIFRSTILPGSTRRIVEDFFSSVGENVSFYFYPEFLRQGSALDDFRRPSLSAIGKLRDTKDPEWIKLLLEAETDWMTVEEAELLKYSCNAFHAAKVTFANEIGRLGKGMGIDSKRVMATLCKDTRLNISSYYMRPGTPFGGSCLPKDVKALTQQARRLGVAVPLLENLIDSNQNHLESLLEIVEKQGRKRVLLVGLAFKEGTDDLRGSAMLELAGSLLLRNYEVRIFDPEVAPHSLIGANKQFAEAKLPRFDSLLVSDLADVLKMDAPPMTIVVSKACVEAGPFGQLLSDRGDDHVIDVNGWSEISDLVPSYEGICW